METTPATITNAQKAVIRETLNGDFGFMATITRSGRNIVKLQNIWVGGGPVIVHILRHVEQAFVDPKKNCVFCVWLITRFGRADRISRIYGIGENRIGSRIYFPLIRPRKSWKSAP